MLKFYDIDLNYINYLKTFDKQVPDIDYGSNSKFVCGIVLKINNIDYYAHVSSFQKQQQTNILIRNTNDRVLSSIRFCFMIPAPSNVLTYKDINLIRQTDANYANLLQEEYNFCVKNEDAILIKAQKVYAIGCNKNHVLNYSCCDFKLLEIASKNWDDSTPNGNLLGGEKYLAGAVSTN